MFSLSVETQIFYMPKTRAQKQDIVSSLANDLGEQKSMVFVDFTGLKVKDMAELRSQLKEQGAKLSVAKKTLFDLAAKEKGLAIDFQGMEGQIGAVFAKEDELAPLKVIYNVSKAHEGLKIIGGYFENKVQEADFMLALARLPGRDELLAKLVGTISNPMRGLVIVLEGNIKGLLVALNAISKKG